MNATQKPFRLAVAAALAVQVSLQAWFALTNGITFDEPMYISAGLYMLRTGFDDFSFEQPPLGKRAAGIAASLAGARCDPARQDKMGNWTLFTLNRDRLGGIIVAARLVTMACAALLTLTAASWARELWGPAAGALAAWLLAIEPNTLAHGSIATCDMMLNLFLLLFARAAWRIAGGAGDRKSRALLGFWAGLALSAKYTSVGYMPALTAAVCLAHLLARDGKRSFRNLAASLPMVIVAGGTTAFVAFSLNPRFWTGSYGQGGLLSWFPVEMTGYTLMFFQWGVTTIFHWMNMDNPAYFLGSLRVGRLPAYFPVAFGLKVQLGLVLAAASALAIRAGSRKLSPRELAPLLFAATIFAVAANAKYHIGVRHVYFVFVSFALLGASLAESGLPRPRLRAGLAAASLLWGALSLGRCAPHFLAHFNELAGGPGGGWRYLADSNLDWGQDLPELAKWCRENGVKKLPFIYFGNADPAYYGVPAAPFRDPVGRNFHPGLCAVSVSLIDGTLIWDLERFAWCRRVTPIARPGWSIHVYDLKSPP